MFFDCYAVEQCRQDLQRMIIKLDSQIESVASVRKELCANETQPFRDEGMKLLQTEKSLIQQNDSLKKMSEALNQVIITYKRTETNNIFLAENMTEANDRRVLPQWIRSFVPPEVYTLLV